MQSFDAQLRRLERTLLADPSDGDTRSQYARSLLRTGHVAEACDLYALRWRVGTAKLDSLIWNKEPLSPNDLEALLEDDLAHFDPEQVARNFPRRRDARFRLNTTVVLRRYPATSGNWGPQNRLYLLARTPLTAMHYTRPDDRTHHAVLIEVAIRSTSKKPWAEPLWRR